jgi:DNA repair protein RadC
MKITDIPKFNRPSSKLMKDGVDSLDTAELMSIIFGIGSKGESAIEVSNRILMKYNLNKIDELGFNELVDEFKGDREKKETGDFVKAMKLLSLIELSKRYNKLVSGGFNSKPISSAKDVYNMFKDKLRNYKKERLYALLLDTKNVVIKEVLVSEGTLNSSLIHPREVFKEAIKESSNSIILVHNHPSGDCSPSDEDIEVTEKLKEVGDSLSIKVLDHVIVGTFSEKDNKKGYWSWVEDN